MIHHIKAKQFNSKMCFVCGMQNNMGLKGQFYETEISEVIGLYTPGEEHQGFPGLLHGGISAAILDETLGRAIIAVYGQGVRAFTAELTTRYIKPVPLGIDLRITGRLISKKDRVIECSGEIYLPDGQAAVSATGKYIEVSSDKFVDSGFADDELFIQPDEEVLTEIEI